MCFIGNFKAYEELVAWLQKEDFPPKLTPRSVLHVIGPPGSGKTFGVRKACHDLELSVINIDTHTVSSFKEFQDIFSKMCASNITAQFGIVQKSKIVFLIDELDALGVLDRSFVACFHKMLETSSMPHCRVVVTSQPGDVKKNINGSTFVELRAADSADIMLFLRGVSPCIPLAAVLEIADSSNGNIGYALNLLQLCAANYDEHSKESQTSEMDVSHNLKDVLRKPSAHAAKSLFAEDPWLLPLRYHENLPSELAQRKGTKATKRKIYVDQLHDICTWDVMMAHFKGEEFDIPIEFLSRASCKLNAIARKKNACAPSDEFTKVFSHLSLEKKNQIGMESSGIIKDGLHSFHKQIYETVFGKQNKKKTFLPDR